MPQQSTSDSASSEPKRQPQSFADVSRSPLQPPTQPSFHFLHDLLDKADLEVLINPEWYKNFEWIEYSVEEDAVFRYARW